MKKLWLDRDSGGRTTITFQSENIYKTSNHLAPADLFQIKQEIEKFLFDILEEEIKGLWLKK